MQRKLLILLLLLFCCNYSFSQIKHIITVDGKMLKVTATKNPSNYSFTIQRMDTEEGKVTFTLDILEPKTFVNYFLINLTKFDNTLSASNKNATNDAIKEANSIFYSTLANTRLLDDLDKKPEVGKIEISKEVNLYENYNIRTKRSWFGKKIHKSDFTYKSQQKIVVNKYKFEITSCQIVIQDGFIQDIAVDGIVKDKKKNTKITSIRFTNKIGIGFSSKRNFINLQNNYLYINKIKNDFTKINPNLSGYALNVGEIIKFYDFELDNFTSDFSPSNQKIVLEGGKSATLHREETYKILEAKVFSDFQGFDSEKPNGLIQIEVDKKFNFWTTRLQKFGFGHGLFQYMKINAGLSKLENNNRFLNPYLKDKFIPKDNLIDFTDDNVGLVTSNRRYSTPIEILNHKSWFIGTELNLYLLEFPNLKSQFHVNVDVSFNKTPIKDTLYTRKTNPDNFEPKERQYGFNYFLISPKIIWHILPEKRFGAFLSYSTRYLYTLNNEVELNPWITSTGETRTHMSKFINEFELMGYLFINEDKKNGKLFCRWRLDSEVGYSKNNFSQFQLGYSFYILASKN